MIRIDNAISFAQIAKTLCGQFSNSVFVYYELGRCKNVAPIAPPLSQNTKIIEFNDRAAIIYAVWMYIRTFQEEHGF